ncbi:hypothetical protein V1525DRAFT_449959 [Lipomyces kononenkoae]|uniref:Uncharacterized protein n=1 Tax=Lipomyces kononenkoae TaxID=34357 RepID=A0ACC3T3F8_LIPKO
MEHSELLEIARRPLSPDTVLEVPASQLQYDLAREILENEDDGYPQLFYDSDRNIAIIAAAPSPMHSEMAGALPGSIFREVIRSQISSDLANGLNIVTEETSTRSTNRGRTTRAWDGALIYSEGTRETLMISVEIGVSQSYSSLRAAISWSMCALGCRLGLALCISEGDRGDIPPIQAFRDQLMHRPYGPLESDCFVWFGNVKEVILDVYRRQDDDYQPGTLLDPHDTFHIVETGEYVAHDVSPNLRDVVMGDCIPSHILSGQVVQETPVNFFRRDWFENTFQRSMVRTATLRVRHKAEVNVHPN